jgi:chain length determinant protein (polysaccharide antigen chain regulator)
MQQNTPDQNYYQEDEIDLKQLFRSLADRKWFIFGFTGLVTALAIAYALSIPPTYKASISFLSPSTSSILQLNKFKLTSETSETSETVYRKFLNKVMSSQFQRKIFDENDYLTRLNPNNSPIKNLDSYIGDFTKSITLESSKDKKGEKGNYEKPIRISLEGGDTAVISDFLNDLTKTADTETVDEFLGIIQQKIDIRLEGISRQITLLKQHEDKIRKNKIQELSYALEMATELGIKNNNLSGLSSSSSSSTSLKIDLSNGESLPKWYLFGENALKKEIDILTRNTHQFIPKIAKLEIKGIRLNSFNISSVGINAIQLNQRAYPLESPIKPKKKLIVAVAFIAGFILSIFLVFIVNAFRKENDKITA